MPRTSISPQTISIASVRGQVVWFSTLLLISSIRLVVYVAAFANYFKASCSTCLAVSAPRCTLVTLTESSDII